MKKFSLLFPLLLLSSCFCQEPKTTHLSNSRINTNAKENNFININVDNPCSRIIYKQVVNKYKNVLQRQKVKNSSYTFSLSILGPSFSFTINPYLDEKETLALKMKIAEDVEKYSQNLQNYLILLRKYLLFKKFYRWEKVRIKTGVDSVKENFSDIKEYEDTYSKVKAMEMEYEIFNIKKYELYQCYLYTYKDKVTNPFELIKKENSK